MHFLNFISSCQNCIIQTYGSFSCNSNKQILNAGLNIRQCDTTWVWEQQRDAWSSVTSPLRPADVPMAAETHSEPRLFPVFFNNLAAQRHLIGWPLSPWRHRSCIIFLTRAETMQRLRCQSQPRLCVWMCVRPAELLLRWPTKAEFLGEKSFLNFYSR